MGNTHTQRRSLRINRWVFPIIISCIFYIMGGIKQVKGQSCGLENSSQYAPADYNCTAPHSLYDYGNKYYIPAEDDEVLILPINIHVMQKADGSGNFQENDSTHMAFFESYINHYLSDINDSKAFRNVGQEEICEDSVTKAPLSIDARISFELDSVYFWQDSIAWENNGCVTNSYIKSNYMTGIEDYYDALNVFLIEQLVEKGKPCSASGWGPGGDTGNENKETYIVMNKVYTSWVNSGGNNWVTTGTLSHEIGHILGLYHINNNEQYDHFNNECHTKDAWLIYNDDNSCMGYNGAQNYFSPLQVASMRRWVLTTWRKRMIKTGSYTYGQAPMEIDSVEEMDDEVVWHGDIIIKAGGKLVVNSILRLSQNNKIEVEQGGKLTINSTGAITTCDEYWDGIYAIGDITKSQFPFSNHALVKVLGGKIEKSKNGIQATEGAVVMISEAEFLNNERAVSIAHYPEQSYSYIKLSHFSIDSNYVFPEPEDARQIVLNNVQNISMYGNSIINYLEGRSGIGIYTLDAGYYIDDYPQDSAFISGWQYGINAKGVCSVNTFSLRNTKFLDNDIGALVESVDYFEALYNSFEMNKTATSMTYGDHDIGMMIDYSSGYDIAFNIFHGYNSGTGLNDEKPIGIVVKDSGNEPNTIEVNNYEACSIANLSNGDNRNTDIIDVYGGLKFKCNGQDQNINDIIIPDESVGHGISTFQGYDDEPAGNTFSDVPEYYYNIRNAGELSSTDTVQYYYKNDSAQYPEAVLGVSLIQIFEPLNCREEYSGGTGVGTGLFAYKDNYLLSNFSSTENAFIDFRDSIYSISPTPSEIAKLSGLKSDYYRLVNDGLFLSVLNDTVGVNIDSFSYYLLKKDSVYKINHEFARLKFLIETDSIRYKANLLQGEDIKFYNSYAAALDSNLLLYTLSESFIDSLLDISDSLDNRVSMLSRNLIEFYTDTIFGKIIVLPDEVINRSQNEISSEPNFAVFPNPMANNGVIQFNGRKSGSIYLYTLNGRKIGQFNLDNQTELQLDLTNVPAGVLIIHFIDKSGKNYSSKIVVP